MIAWEGQHSSPDGFSTRDRGRAQGRALPYLIGESPAFLDALEDVTRAGEEGSRGVLLVGESGTGKTLLAREVHYRARDRDQPFVAVSCNALPAEVLEVELFGAEREAIPGLRRMKRGLLELAGRGTVLLEDAEALPLILQDRLARAISRKEAVRPGGPTRFPVECRIAVESRRSPEEASAGGRFSERLLERVAEHRIEVPTLRMRRGDLPVLVRFFEEHWARSESAVPKRISPRALRALERHGWPGNVRELRHTVEAALARTPHAEIRTEHLRIQERWLRPVTGEDGESGAEIRIPAEGRSIASVEKELVRVTLGITSGNRSAAARILGISRPTLTRKIRKYEVAIPDPS